MTKWVRWQGLAGFAAVLVLVLVFWYLLADRLVERLIEETGTKMVGAKVELAKADLSLFPFGLTLQGLQVANPHEPMKNAVEVGRISCKIDAFNLLLRKIIIEEMSMERVRVGTPRTHSGAIPKTPKEPSSQEKKREGKLPAIEIPSFDLASVEKILQKEDLKSVRLAESLQKDMTAEKGKWQKRLAELPDQKKIDEYKNRIEKVRSSSRGGIGGIVGGAGDALKIQQEIAGEIDRIRRMQNEVSVKLTSWKSQITELEKAPLEDIKHLKDKYGPSSLQTGNWARLLLKGKAQEWVEKALFWREKLNPLLERPKEKKGKAEIVKPIRGKGVDVRYPETHPVPDFLIHLLNASLQLDIGDLTARIQDITPDPEILGRPLRFMLAGEKLKLASRVKVEGVLDHISPARRSDQIKVAVQGYQTKDLSLSAREDFPLKLMDGNADFDLQGTLRKDTIAADLTTTLKSTRFELGKKGESTPWQAAMGSALEGISNFSVKAKVSGPLDHYQVEVSSDLWDQIKNAVQSQLQKYAANFEKELSSKVFSKVGSPIQGAKASLGGFGVIQKEIENRLRQLTGLQSKEIFQKLPGGVKFPL